MKWGWFESVGGSCRRACNPQVGNSDEGKPTIGKSAGLHKQRWWRDIRAGWIISSNLTLAATVFFNIKHAKDILTCDTVSNLSAQRNRNRRRRVRREQTYWNACVHPVQSQWRMPADWCPAQRRTDYRNDSPWRNQGNQDGGTAEAPAVAIWITDVSTWPTHLPQRLEGGIRRQVGDGCNVHSRT